ncbi:MAG: M28 family peptidase [Balneolaceae bacterium]
MKHLSLFPILLLLFVGCSTSNSTQFTSPTPSVTSFSDVITPQLLRTHLEVIAHDSLEGREAGTRGERMAAQYIIDYYETIGVEPMGTEGYLQPFILNANQTDSLVYTLHRMDGDEQLPVSRHLQSRHETSPILRLFGGAEPQQGSIIFSGFGVNDSPRGVNHADPAQIGGNWALIYQTIPYVVDGDTLVNPGISNNARLGALLNQADAGGVLVIPDMTDEEFDEVAGIDAEFFGQPESMRLKYLDDSDGAGGFPKVYAMIRPSKAAELLGLSGADELAGHREQLVQQIRDFEPQATPFALDYTPYAGVTEVVSNNVIGYVEGGHPELKEEVVVLMAHYDHIGITGPDETGDRINNGADDNGSGTVALMSIATALQEAAEAGSRLDRSVLLVHVTAEEKGLLGSRYYSDHPVVPIEQTVAAFNADMIGRSDQQNVAAGDTDYVYLIGGEIISSELDSLVRVANDRSVDMRLDPRYNDLTDPNQFYRRSDHWNLGRLNVPFVFFFTGVHEDYHRPGDEVEKIDFEKLSRITRLIFQSTGEVANYDGRPAVDNQAFIDITRRQAR